MITQQVIHCPDCGRPTTHDVFHNGLLVCCLFCSSTQHLCRAGCGTYCPTEQATCSEACETAVRR